jgi:16S rRNA (guanine527-N7)-methyltransferase
VSRADIAGLAERFALDATMARQLEALLELTIEDPLAPTAIRGRRHALDDHLADSLVALELDAVRAAGTVADLGSGAGLPGLPLAIALPRAEVYLVEGSARKAEFAARAIRTCGVGNAHSVHARAEEWGEGVGRCDVVTARALAPLPVVAEYAAPLLRLGGLLVAWRGRRDTGEEAAAGRAAAELGLDVGAVRPVKPYPEARHRHLHLFSKVVDTPPAYPRRPGMARKRPLGA